MEGESTLQRVGISLGSNVGDRLANLEAACDALSEHFGALRLSQVYETEPVNCPPGSPAFLNACVELHTALPPQRVLELCLGIEQQLGRTRTGEYGAPRTCDIDILYYGTLVQSGPELTLPHPRAHSRLFVLRPLCDIDPLLVFPGQTRTVQQLAEALPNQAAVVPFPI
ncbi:MAG: 2-amino-4-hydroxy-6-hydroxymethyldihydropteridine diphosphokinase [Akkermansia muciniphila]|nr:2-amino-4-hydroxy-6-hydroxymethyldihydropteridine diphosphokinase [Akkermansia muciniphila]